MISPITRLGWVPAALMLSTAIAFMFAAGCMSSEPSSLAGGDGSEPEARAAQKTIKGGAQLWTENCMRCHNIRDPKSLSDDQWQVAVRHMRVRANLTANEHEKILAFLKAAN
jgi:mono/diheme cytochrome c family protein